MRGRGPYVLMCQALSGTVVKETLKESADMDCSAYDKLIFAPVYPLDLRDDTARERERDSGSRF